MKKTTLFILIILIILAVYFYFKSATEGFVSAGDQLTIKGDNAYASLIFLNKAQKSVDLTSDEINAVFPTVTACKDIVIPASGIVKMPAYITKSCYDALLTKYSLIAGENLPAKPVINLSVDEIAATLSAFIQQKGKMTEYTAASMTDELAKQGTFCKQTKIGKTDYVGPICYNALLKKYVTDVVVEPAAAATTATTAVTTAVEPVVEQSAKDFRISYFKNLTMIAGMDMKTDEIEKLYNKTTSCTKDSNEYDIDCLQEMADKQGIKIGTESSTVDDALNALKSTAAAAKKQTVDFGKKIEKSPQTNGGLQEDVEENSKTPAINQGAEFKKKTPKVNVIDLRDYIHKDKIPCWSCKL